MRDSVGLGQPAPHFHSLGWPTSRPYYLCCKNNSVGETEPTASLVGRLFSFQSEDFPDKLNLPKDIPFRQPPHLAFPDHVQNLIALNRPPASIERSKALAGWSSVVCRSLLPRKDSRSGSR